MVSRARAHGRAYARIPFLEYTVITEHSNVVAIGFAELVSAVFKYRRKLILSELEKKK